MVGGRIWRLAATAAIAGAVFVGCSSEGTLSTDDVQKVLDDSPLKDQVSKLDCPEVKGKKGNTFECDAEIAGAKVTLVGEFTEENTFEIVDVLDENGESLSSAPGTPSEE